MCWSPSEVSRAGLRENSVVSEPVRVCALDRIRRGEGYRFAGVDPPIAIFHAHDGTVYAIDDTCTHQDASLAAGWLEGHEVECPLHSSRFDLRTGEVDAPPATVGVRAHRASVIDGMVVVELSDEPPPEEI